MKIFTCAFFFICSSLNLFSQAGQVDLSFNAADYGYNSGISANNSITSIARTLDNKIIIGGYFTSYNSYPHNHLARIDQNGVIDLTFDIGAGFNDDVKKVKVQSDGKIVVSGVFTSYNGNSANKLVRLNADGSYDNTFNYGTGANSIVQDFTIQDDGKILVFGNFTSFSGQAAKRIIRLNPDGSIDTSFDTSIGADTNFITCAIELASGKVIIGGNFNSFNGMPSSGLACLNSDGSLDANFSANIGTGLNNINDLVETSDGKIIAVGYFSNVPGIPSNWIVQFNTDGTVDSSFNTGTSFNDNCNEVVIDDQNRIIVLGTFDTYNGAPAAQICRLLSDGTLDPTFTSGTNFVGLTMPLSPIFMEDGEIMVCGGFTTYANEPEKYIVRLNTDGSLDTGFNPKTAFNSGSVRAVKQLNDGRIVIGGQFDNYFGETVYGLIMTDANGVRDMSFNIGTGILPITGYINCIEQGANDDIIIGGTFTSVDGQALTNFAVISTDGIVNNTINPNPNGIVNAILVASNNDLIVGGAFTNIDGQNDGYLVRMNQFGQLVNNNSNGALNGAVNDLAWLGDGSFIAVGSFTQYLSSTENKIIRINAAGNPTSDFPGTGFSGTLHAVAVQDDGSVVVGGNFGSYNGTLINNLLRFNSALQMDPTFDIGVGTANSNGIGQINDIIIDSGNKIVMAGAFNLYDNQTAGYIARLNNDGSLDNTFETGSGADFDIESVIQLEDGRYLAGGFFKSFNGIGRNRIVAINSCNSTTSSISETACDSYTLNGQEYTVSGNFEQVLMNSTGCDSLVYLNLNILQSSSYSIDANSCGPYFYNNIQYNNSGVYEILYENSVGCDSIVTLDLNVVNLNMNVTLNNSVLSSSEAGAQYQWIDCTNGSVEIPNATNQTYSPTDNGSYAVFVTENGCTDVSECVDVTTIIGVEEMSVSDVVSAYPNPFADQLNIVFSNGGMFKVEVLNAMGEVVILEWSSHSLNLDVSSLPRGAYTLRVSNEQFEHSQVILK
ncbi:MAG: hypothetical protein RL204_140 [Bacteroidota bacterium]|jgi:uncharacterized delta-60 repeat protein